MSIDVKEPDMIVLSTCYYQALLLANYYLIDLLKM